MKRFAILAPLLLAACAGKMPTPEPRVIIQEIRVPVPVSCAPEVDKRPDYPDAKETLRGLPLDEQLRRFGAARELRGPYEDQIEAALAKCK